MKREIHLDYAKVFACFAVMIQHNCSLSGELRADYMTNYILYFLCRFAVPVFVITTGCLMLNDKRQLTFRDIFTKYIPRILLPFIGIVYIINITSALVDGTASWTLLYTPLASILAAQTSVPYWYCYMIIGLYIILPFIKHMVSACTKRELEIYLLLFFIFRGVLPYLQFVSLLDKCTPFLDSINLIIFNGYLGYLIVGYYLNKFVPVVSRKLCIASGAAILVCIALPLGIMLLSDTHYQTIGSYFSDVFSPNMMLLSVALLLFLKGLLANSRHHHRLIVAISKLTFEMYLLHVFVMQVFNYLHIPPIGNTVTNIIVRSVLNFILCYIAVWIYSRLKKRGTALLQQKRPSQ